MALSANRPISLMTFRKAYGLRVLLVDDHPFVLSAMEDVLRATGLTVTPVSSESLAFDALETAGGFSLLVTDVHVGSGSGWDVARKAREACPAIPVIYVSADADREFECEAVSGAVLLSKPFGMETLSKALAAFGLTSETPTEDPTVAIDNSHCLTVEPRRRAA